MKIKLFLIFGLIYTTALGANALVAVDQTLTKEYMMNNGYSEQIYDSVNVSRARALGKKYYSQDEQNYANKNKAGKFFKKFHAYVDPAIDDYTFYHHDIITEPSVDDL